MLNRLVRPLVKAGLGSPLPLGLRVGDKVVVSTVREKSQWLKNVEANEQTAVWYCGRRHETNAAVRRGPLNVVTLTRSRRR